MLLAGTGDRQALGDAGQQGLLRGRQGQCLLYNIILNVAERSSGGRGGLQDTGRDRGGGREGKGGGFRGTDSICRACAVRYCRKLSQVVRAVVRY